MSHAFEGTRVVVTGASRGVGFHTAKLLLEAGAEVHAVARDPERLMKAVKSLAPLGSIQATAVDLAQADAGERVAVEVEARWGALDVLFNNAGIQQWCPCLEQEPVDALERNIALNLLAPHWLIRALLPALERGNAPRIINVSSGAGSRKDVAQQVDMPAYRLSKYALNGLTMSYAACLRGRIAVNALDPGWLKTDMGGPEAPGEPIDGARRALAVMAKPPSVTGKIWYGDEEIDY
jgi:NAD(P)-dependent dehydrogenase (short-subunit alcohol dehydrogenase family)